MNDYFCVMPFFGAEYDATGFKTSCCIIKPNNANISKIRQQMLTGQRPAECESCWKLENSGKASDRQLKNSAFDFYADRDILSIEKDCADGKFSEQIIKIYTSNVCNSTCVTCSEKFSSAWASIKKLPIQLNKFSADSISDSLYQTVKMLSFVGGEPLYEKENWVILEKLIANQNTNCFISIVTNGSAMLTDAQRELLSKFKNLNITVSIDGVGPVFEYIRFPIKWDDLIINLNQFKSITNNISVSYTISNLNALYHEETIKWFNDNKLPYNHNLVCSPNYFNINVLPKSIKNQQTNIHHLLREHISNDEKLLDKFKEEIAYQDLLKGISIKNYLPELAKALSI